MPNKTQIKRQVSAKSLDNKPFLFILSFSICSKQKKKKKKRKKKEKETEKIRTQLLRYQSNQTIILIRWNLNKIIYIT